MMLRSELLKLKNSTGLYLISIFTLLELLTIPTYLYFGKSPISMLDMSLLTMLVFPIFISILSILTFDQESLANHFQEIKTSGKVIRIWLSKLLVMDLLLFFPSFMIWLLTGILMDNMNQGLLIASASWLLAIFLYHFHMLLNFLLQKGENIIVSIIEILFLIFASNKALLGAYWCPVVLPVNYLLTTKIVHLIVEVGWICLSTTGIAWLSRKK